MYIKVHGPKNKMTTVTWEAQVDRAFRRPSEERDLKETKMAMYDETKVIKELRAMTPLLETTMTPIM